MATGNPLVLMVGMDISTTTMGITVEVSQKTKIPYNPAMPLLGIELCVLSYCGTVTTFWNNTGSQ